MVYVATITRHKGAPGLANNSTMPKTVSSVSGSFRFLTSRPSFRFAPCLTALHIGCFVGETSTPANSWWVKIAALAHLTTEYEAAFATTAVRNKATVNGFAGTATYSRSAQNAQKASQGPLYCLSDDNAREPATNCCVAPKSASRGPQAEPGGGAGEYCGNEFEKRILSNEKNNVKFNFLVPTDPYHAYYKLRIKDFSAEDGAAPKDQAAGGATPALPSGPLPPALVVLPPKATVKPLEKPEDEQYTAFPL
ncbi:putative splicing factor 3A subunit 1 [Tetrabaena socialis]|uniref:Putative splicing factor 3A subunit 1 n=1 Tax=Tetrabaena socialis TaxID=47790 RepID=A0A2J8AD37_9CHLO|nr:putative splicing factor 3A subunit 1 [Tetrabaena socialis]|eukprot:PNH10435.1 putative splicing factor 3A subunit 1 [Tetrabaena socialis]